MKLVFVTVQILVRTWTVSIDRSPSNEASSYVRPPLSSSCSERGYSHYLSIAL
jgi:hypothetical protein